MVGNLFSGKHRLQMYFIGNYWHEGVGTRLETLLVGLVCIWLSLVGPELEVGAQHREFGSH